MKRLLLYFAAPAILCGAFFMFSSHSTTPLSSAPSDEAAEAEFVGSAACAGCHSAQYADWEASGHPYKFTVVTGGVEPTYPAEAINFQSQYMDSLGDGSHTWNDIAGVIGGYG